MTPPAPLVVLTRPTWHVHDDGRLVLHTPDGGGAVVPLTVDQQLILAAALIRSAQRRLAPPPSER